MSHGNISYQTHAFACSAAVFFTVFAFLLSHFTFTVNTFSSSLFVLDADIA